ncbi:guanylate cyclase, putative [Bodo saltans]|uniref:Guanylate cyclase, putative n=1 Tax=Bodo saltans TaxID=75058 RepID=A0A0S4JXN5_BODSA|nr:guanylate cyclase, putative [Bodo saltans]|eukprot:CUG94185.1 guanylate cyclase, putative [Bodo saltans]
MRADEIVDFLNEVFLEFDTIVELLELEKIKTIGDAYFMAGGLDPRISDHAMRVIEAGIMFYKALEEHNARHPDRNILQMRLGIHTGPAVAGVIGTKKVAYDLWGESVEIANAMESTGIPGRVHISEDTAKHVTGFYRLENRGELPREKEHIPDTMPATFLITGRLLPTPYQHIQRPRMVKQKLAGDAVK